MFEKVIENYDLNVLRADQISKAERRMGIKFPADLSYFYKEYGYGFLKNKGCAICRLMDPGSCADVRLREDFYEYDPDLEMYEDYEDKKLIFFEINEGVYAMIGLEDGKIYYCDKLIADSLEEYLEKTAENCDYWNN